MIGQGPIILGIECVNAFLLCCVDWIGCVILVCGMGS